MATDRVFSFSEVQRRHIVLTIVRCNFKRLHEDSKDYNSLQPYHILVWVNSIRVIKKIVLVFAGFLFMDIGYYVLHWCPC